MGPFVAMVALACTGISFFCTPFFSTLTDRHSRKLILVIVQALQASTASLVFVAYWFDLGSHWLLAFAQLAFWISSNLAWTTNNAFTQENYDPHEYASISGKQEVIMQGTTLGAGALGVVLLEVWGMLEFAAFAAVASGIATLCYIYTPYRRKLRINNAMPFLAQLKESKQLIVNEPRFYLFLMLSALSYPVLTYLGKLVPIWFAESGISGEWLAGYNLAFGLGSLITGLFVARLLGLFSAQNTMLSTMAICGFTVVGMSVSPHPIYLLLFTLIFGFFNAMNRIARTNWMHVSVEVGSRGRADGILQMFATLVQSVSYVAIALLSHYQVTQFGFVLAAMVMLLASFSMYLLSKKPLKHAGVIEAC
ncbi:permease of the major facilitator superfamily [Vibrio ishigakensis]|uniref:Permease of the major facilitator superfamily n=2 Tax=Vibrio ishigakensis TaxID=1481914 RepID=A0A0B8NZ26_9VIBR|nr:permease of the major facilitator superfamily [Vibrio ishigakensis]